MPHVIVRLWPGKCEKQRAVPRMRSSPEMRVGLVLARSFAWGRN